MAPTRADVCVVGGGPAGLLLGLLLAKRGAEVLVLEGHETFDREFRGEVLQPSTAHLLDELGLLEYVLAQPHSILDAGQAAGERRGGRRVLLPARSRPSIPTPSGCRSRSSSQALAAEGRSRSRASSAGWAPRSPSWWRRTARVVGVTGPAPRQGAVRDPGRRGRGRRRPLLRDRAAGRVRDRVRAPRLRRDLVHRSSSRRAGPARSTSRWAEVRGLMLPKYPHHIQAGHRPADGRVAALAAGGRRGGGRARPAARPALHRLRRRAERLHAVFPARGPHPAGPRLGPRRPAADRRRRPHDEPGRGDRRERRPRDRRGRRPGDLPAARAGGRSRGARWPGSRRYARRTCGRSTGSSSGAPVAAARSGQRNPLDRWLVPRVLPLVVRSPLLPRFQRRLFFGAPLPPLDPAFSFRAGPSSVD